MKVLGNSELVVHQVRGISSAKHVRMRSYRARAWDLIESFDAFNIISIPWKLNTIADQMATIGAQFDPSTSLLTRSQVVGLFVHPTIPNNDTHWQVFESDEQIALFIQISGEFFDQLQPKVKEAYRNQVIQLKSNKLPNGLITLENLFDHEEAKNDKQKLTTNKEDYVEMSVGSGRVLKVGKYVSSEDKKKLARYCDEYEGVLAWFYDNLRGYDPNIIQHTIELANEAKPVWWKQRPVNPKIESLIAQELKNLIESRIIYPIKYSTWVSNLVPIRRKNGDIWLYVDL